MTDHSDFMDVSFKPALLRHARSYTLAGGILSLSKGTDAPWHLALTDVESAFFVDQTHQKQRFTRLDLKTGETTRSLNISAPRHGWRDQSDVQSYLSLTSAVAAGLEQAQPGFRIAFGEYGKPRLIMFVIGVLTSLFSIGLFALVLYTGVLGDRLVAGGGMMVLLLLFGVALLWIYRPWRKPALVPAKSVVSMLRAWAQG